MSRGRPYCKVSPRLHTGSFGRSIRGETEDALRQQSLSGYLTACPHGNAIGLFFLPVGYIMADRGWGSDGAYDALFSLEERGLIRYVRETEWVWVVEHFRIEYGPDPERSADDGKKEDSRLPLIRKLLDEAAGSGLRAAFLQHHRPSYPYLLGEFDVPSDGALDAPSDGCLPRARTRSGSGSGSGTGFKKTPTESFVDAADAAPDDKGEAPAKLVKRKQLTELRWRIDQVWEIYLKAREWFWQKKEYRARAPGTPPELTAARRKLIGEALKRHDRKLMGAGDRENWTEWSKVRAAGIGIFEDDWMGGNADGNRRGQGGKLFLSPEYAWSIRKGIDNVERFAELYFQNRKDKRIDT